MYLGRDGGCAATFSVTLTPHSTEMTEEKFLWNYFTFSGTPFHLQLIAREKTWTRGRKLSTRKLDLKTDLKKGVGALSWKDAFTTILRIQWSSLISLVVSSTVNNMNNKSALVTTLNTTDFGMNKRTTALRLNTGFGTLIWNTGQN